jgi:SAM-dependent methyltransferase
MGIYERRLFPRLMDWSMRGLAELREETLAAARGDVLEVGFGTGLNLRHYPPSVGSLVAVDPLDALEDRVARRIAAAPFPVERARLAAGGRLPFESGSFDCVVTTWTLCSIADPVPALLEMRRVLRSGGLYLFIEHGQSDDERIARWQARLNPIQRRIGCGCLLDRRIDALVREGHFEIQKLARFVPEGRPRIWETLYRGVATT